MKYAISYHKNDVTYADSPREVASKTIANLGLPEHVRGRMIDRLVYHLSGPGKAVHFHGKGIKGFTVERVS